MSLRRRPGRGGERGSGVGDPEPAAPRAELGPAARARRAADALGLQLEAQREVHSKAAVAGAGAAVVVPEQAATSLQTSRRVGDDARQGAVAQSRRPPKDHCSAVACMVAERRVVQSGASFVAWPGGVDRWAQSDAKSQERRQGQHVVARHPVEDHLAEVECQRRVRRGQVAVREGEASAGSLVWPEAKPRRGGAIRELGEERSDPGVQQLDVGVQGGVAGGEVTACERAPVGPPGEFERLRVGSPGGWTSVRSRGRAAWGG